jgi:nitrite reductase/ring-hydroxylating ferredoxin subunit
LLLGAVAGAVAGCSTAAVPYGADEAGQLPGDDAPTPSTSMMATQGSQGTGSQGMGSQGTGSQGMGSGSQGTGSGTGSTTVTGKVLGDVKDIPVGSGVIYTAAQVVVTQPVKGEYHAFSAVCTHVGCILNKIANGTIDCPCHGSEFKITNGAVVAGPAPTPLPKKKFKIEDGKVVLL